MNILITSALFPPDVADPAPYLKELSGRLATEHSVAVLAYGSIPEAVDQVKISTVPKKIPGLIRALVFTFLMFKESLSADVILIQNAPSTELPLIFIGLPFRSKLFLQLSDQKIVYTGWRKMIHTVARKVAGNYIDITLPLTCPEKLPFSELSSRAISDYENSWDKHLAKLKSRLS